MNLINQYFPDLSEIQKTQFRQLLPLYEDWNQKINVISRKDINNLYERHVLHSLAIGKFIQFKPGSQILDLGTGGGFPGIPLAILFPDAHFHLVDSIGKKLKVIKNIAGEIGLTNIKTSHSRVEDIHEKVDFVVCRAVAPIEKLVHWTKKIYLNHMIHGFPNGLIALKGGSLTEEIKQLPTGTYTEQVALRHYFKEEFFEEKFLVYVQA